MPRLITTDGPDAGRSWPLQGAEVVVGRGEGCGVQLTDLTVSRQHFRLVPERQGTSWRLIDLGSRNRTVVNQGPVYEHSLRDGDVIVVGGTRFQYAVGGEQGPDLDVRAVGLERVTMEVGGVAGPVAHAAALAPALRMCEALAGLDRVLAVCQALAREARRELEAERAVVFLVEPGAPPRPVAREQEDPADDRVSVSRTVLDKVLLGGVSVGCVDTAGDPQLSLRDSIVSQAIRSVLCVPLTEAGRTTGLLYLDNRRPGRTFKPTDLQLLTCLAQQAGVVLAQVRLRERLQAENERLHGLLRTSVELVGESTAIRAARAFVRRVAPLDEPVLLCGEVGTGKHLVARALHLDGPRPEGPFVRVSGARPGATEDDPLARAAGGTLYLDDLDTLPEDELQAALGRPGVRVVAASRWPDTAPDWPHRLDLPPLRARSEDVPTLVQHFLQRYAERTARPIDGVAPEALDALLSHRWPGNVRELKNTVERALLLGRGPTLQVADLPSDLGAVPTDAGVRSLQALEREGLVRALAAAGGDRHRAAELLEIDRATLYKKLKDHAMEG